MVMGALFMSSCSNDDSIECPNPLVGELNATETEFSGTWVFSGMVADEALDFTDDKIENPSTDLFAQQKACDRDLVYDFMGDRSYSLKKSYTALDCNNKQSLTGTWSLNAAKALTFVANCASQTTQITTSESGDSFSYEVTSSFREVSGAIKIVKVTYTYTRVVEDESPQ